VKRAFVWVIIAGALLASWTARVALFSRIPPQLLGLTPHAHYAVQLRLDSAFRDDAAERWLGAARTVIASAAAAEVPDTVEASLTDAEPAAAWSVVMRRGQRLTVEALDLPRMPFVDVLRPETQPGEDGQRADTVSSATPDASALVYDADDDGPLIVRVQARLGEGGGVRVALASSPSMGFPVRDVAPRRAVGSVYGDPRDGGGRRHEGIDIFAPRGTAVVASADGWVTSRITNRLGGNVVWVWSPSRRLTSYYAHLDRHAVTPGERVTAGDVLGYVGNTGDARTTAPHLRCGIYASDGAIDPLPFVCDAECGARAARRPRSRTPH